MGKAQKRTFRSRNNPLGAPAVSGAVTTVQSKEEVPVLITKLSSSDANDRAWAAASANNLLAAGDAKVRRMLLSNRISSALIERLSDSVPDVVALASGALCSLAAVDQGAAEEIGRRNVYGAIQPLIPRLASSIDGIVKQSAEGARLDGEGRKAVFLTTDNLLTVLWILCETVPSSLKQINGMTLIPFIVSFFKVADKLPISLVQTAGRLLHALTEDNMPAKRALLSHPGSVGVLYSAVKTEQLGGTGSGDDVAVVRMLAGAVLVNLKGPAMEQIEKQNAGSPEGSLAEEVQMWDDATREILRIVGAITSFDAQAAAAHAATLVRDGMEKEVDLDRLRAQMDYVQMALELAANIFTDEGASDDTAADAKDAAAVEEENLSHDENSKHDGMDDDSGSGGESDGNEGFDHDDMEDVLEREKTSDQGTENAVQQSVLGMFIESIVPALLRLAEPTRMSLLPAAIAECAAEADSAAADLAETAVEGFVALHERALGCFNNFLLVMEETLKPWFYQHSHCVETWWRFLISVAEHILGVEDATGKRSDADRSLRWAVLEPAVSCMWTLARCVDGAVPASMEQIEGIIRLCESAPSTDVRVKTAGVLGNIARRQPGFVDENRRAGVYLLEQVVARPLGALAQSDAGLADGIDPEPILEALDLLFDVYGDMAYDYDEPVFVRGGLLSQLRQLYQPMRRLCKSVDRRKKRRLRDRCDLATINLRAFIDYKASER
ncbi:hypothetical protein H4S08_001030 [Coemansia sp. RSA 1365]|nr:hypothetical protein H4S08_001030 [Coemansia sp. RSA 1365]